MDEVVIEESAPKIKQFFFLKQSGGENMRKYHDVLANSLVAQYRKDEINVLSAYSCLEAVYAFGDDTQSLLKAVVFL